MGESDKSSFWKTVGMIGAAAASYMERESYSKARSFKHRKDIKNHEELSDYFEQMGVGFSEFRQIFEGTYNWNKDEDEVTDDYYDEDEVTDDYYNYDYDYIEDDSETEQGEPNYEHKIEYDGRFSNISAMNLDELEQCRQILLEEYKDEESIYPCITRINDQLQTLYNRERFLWHNKIDNAGLIELDSLENQIKSSYHSEPFIQELKDLIDIRKDTLKQKAIIEELEKYKIGHYEELKRIWRDYLNEKGSSACSTHEGKQIVSYINDEEKRLLSEKCKSLSVMSIDELEALRDELLDSRFNISNRAPYINSIADTLEIRYRKEYERWTQHIDSLSLEEMDGLEDQINIQNYPKETITRISSHVNWRRDCLKKEKCLSGIENIRYNLHVALYSSTYISMLGYFNSQGRISNKDEIPIFMIDGVASVAMSKSMLWIYSSGKLFSEYLYNIIAIQITSKLFSNVLIVNLKSGRNVSFSIQNGLLQLQGQREDGGMR